MRNRATKAALVVVAVLVGVTVVAAYALWLRAVPVHVVRPVRGALEETVHGPGYVRSRIEVVVGSRITSSVTALQADHGDRVRAGQALAALDERDVVARTAAAGEAFATARRDIVAAEAGLEKARAQLELAQRNFKRDHDLFEQDILAEASVDITRAALRVAESELKNARANLAARQARAKGAEADLRFAEVEVAYTRIVAPMDAVVVSRDAEVGSTVVPGSALFHLVDVSSLWVVARIDESVVGRVRVGQKARIRLREGGEASGTVARVGLVGDATTRELEVSIAFDAPPERFAIDQEAEVMIAVGHAEGLVLPASAVIPRDGRGEVIVISDGRASLRPLKLGAVANDRAVVVEGLKQDDLVIREPSAVRPGSRVRGLEDG